MNAQTILDNVNKYRYGVLIGNVAEERFGLDLVKKEVILNIPPSLPLSVCTHIQKEYVWH